MKINFMAKDGTKVVFREPKMSDVKSMMSFANRIISEKRSGMVMNKKLTLKEEKEFLRKTIKNKERDSVFLVVDYKGKIVGTTNIARRTGKQYHVANFGIMLSKDMRGKGIGEALMRTIIKLAKKKIMGLEIIRLDVYDYNKRALSLYRKLKFKKITILPDSDKEDGKYISTIVLYLYLKKRAR